MTSLEMRETKAYKTYLGYATGVTPHKKTRKFKKPASPKLSQFHLKNPQGSQRELRDLPRSLLMRQQQYEEVRKKSLRDFYKTHPSGSGTVTKIAPSAAKIKPSITNEGTGAKPGVPDVTDEESTKSNDQDSDSGDDNTQSDKENGLDSEHETDENETGSESDQEENEEEVEDDEEEKEDESVKTPSNYTSTDDEDETNVESKVEDKAEGDEDKGMDYTTNQFDDDVNVRLNEPVNTDEGFIQKEGADAEMINVSRGRLGMREDSALEKEVAELKKDDLLNTQVTALVDEHLDSRLGATRDKLMSYLSASITARITEQVKI
ncbi:hypothetical protein Tco_0333332 [Tanacetum coccineum]